MYNLNININVAEGIYLKDPLQTDLGKKILYNAILMIYNIGYEELNFNKLAKQANTTEASVYRYFENKYKLLAYLNAWYWDFMYFMVLMDVRNLDDPKSKLKQAVATLVNSLDEMMTPDYIDHNKLHVVVVENSAKVYHNKKVDKLNNEGLYVNYKKIVKLLSDMIVDVDSAFKYPTALATNIIEQSLNNEYYIEHLPSLTDSISHNKNPKQETIAMISYMVDRQL